MKKLSLFFAILIELICFLPACVSLDTEPTDMATTTNYFSNQTEVEYALNAVYDKIASGPLYGGGDCLIAMFDVADQMWSAFTNSPRVFNYVASDAWPNTIWQALYSGIERANILLENIDNPEMDEKARTYIKGETKFIRAYFYFLLVQNYGAVPLKIKPTSSVNDIYCERTSASEVYDFVYREMKEAEAMVLPITTFNHAGRVTQSAVQGVLARVCLYMAGFPNNVNKTDEQIKAHYTDALFWAEKVINSGLHQLNPDYAQIFINLMQDKYDTKESIWEVEYYIDGATGVYASAEGGGIGNNNGIDQRILEFGYSGGQYRIQPKLYKAYENSAQYKDVRRDWAIAPYRFKTSANPPVKEYWETIYSGEGRLTERFVGKYRREYELITSKILNYTSANFPLLRYADVLLMAAEAENELNGPTAKAHDYVNKVRARAHTSPYVNIMQKDDFRKIVQNERHLELCFEGMRKMDLIRWGIFIPTMKELMDYNNQNGIDSRATLPAINVSEKDYYLPIPVREISLNPLLTQNPGW